MVRNAASALALAAVIVTPRAQTPNQPTSQFRAGIDLVQLDVSVLDKKTHRPVRGLTMADFTVLEDGNPQPIAAFAAVDVPDPPAVPVVAGKPVTWMRDVPPDVQSNVSAGAPDSRLFVMVIDDAMIPLEPFVVQQTKKAARRVIERLSPADRMAVVFTAESIHAQDFTTDRVKLLGAIERMRPGYAFNTFGWEEAHPTSSGGRVGQQATAWQPPARLDKDIGVREMTIGTLVGVADALMAAPDRRKTLVYISTGVPLNAADGTRIRLANGELLASHEANVKLLSELPEIFRRMQRANINIYAIDPSGVAGMGPIIERAIRQIQPNGTGIVDPLTGDTFGINPSTGAHESGVAPFADQWGVFAAKLDLDFLVMAATNTGGRAIVNNDDFEPGIAQMFEENGSYYLLGYKAPPGDPPGTLHRLTVRVNRDGVDVRTRSGYYTPKPEKIDPRTSPPSPTSRAVAHLLPDGSLPLQVATAPFAWQPPPPARGEKPAKDPPSATVAIVLGLSRPGPPKPISDSVQVQISAFTEDGFDRGSSTQLATVAIRASTTTDPVRYEALSHVELKPGRYQLRIAAYSAVSDVTGSVFADVEVPDFRKDPLSLSGALLEVSPPVPSAPRDVLAPIVPVVPTSERAFLKLDRVSAFVRVYQGGTDPVRSVSVKTSIVNERGEDVASRDDTIAPAQFDAGRRAADVRYELPLTTLARGAYLLTFEASDGVHAATRPVRFSVR